jgi:hypothetical protein
MATTVTTTLTTVSAASAAAFWLIVVCTSATAAAIAVASITVSAAIAATFQLIFVCNICCLCLRHHVYHHCIPISRCFCCRRWLRSRCQHGKGVFEPKCPLGLGHWGKFFCNMHIAIFYLCMNIAYCNMNTKMQYGYFSSK